MSEINVINWLFKNGNPVVRYRTYRETYLFPKEYLKGKRNSYFITGAQMGLGENRRRKLALEIESTFWMMKIKKNIGFKSVFCILSKKFQVDKKYQKMLEQFVFV